MARNSGLTGRRRAAARAGAAGRWAALAAALWSFVVCVGVPHAARAEERLPKKLEGITIQEHLGRQVNLDLPFVDSSGKQVRLRDYFQDGKPVLLSLNYYGCETLCSIQLNALNQGLRGLTWTPGEHFRVVTVSINHRETAELAKKKRESYLAALARGDDVDWSFLVGSEANIKTLADTLGFSYRYDPEQDQYAHPAAIYFLSPTGKVTRYLYGIEYPSRDIKFALLDASEGVLGSTVDRLILSCFHYDATEGRYGPFALGMMRVGGVLTASVLGVWLSLMWRRDQMDGSARSGAGIWRGSSAGSVRRDV